MPCLSHTQLGSLADSHSALVHGDFSSEKLLSELVSKLSIYWVTGIFLDSLNDRLWDSYPTESSMNTGIFV